jgi:organic hydroperoxide reductase OsmC/OhrA
MTRAVRELTRSSKQEDAERVSSVAETVHFTCPLSAALNRNDRLKTASWQEADSRMMRMHDHSESETV